MSKEMQRRFILLLSAYVNKNNCSKKCILDYIKDNNWIIISERDKQLNPKINEPIWRNELAFVRKHLVSENYICNDEIWLYHSQGTSRIQLQGDYGAFGSLLCGESKRYIT